MKHIPSLLLAMLFSITTLHGLIIIQGDDTEPPYGFTIPITAKVLQKSTGTFFVGLGAGTSGDGTFAISKALRPNFLSTPKFIGIATNDLVNNSAIAFLAVSDQEKCKTIVTYVRGFPTAAFQQVFAIFDNGSGFTESINDDDTDLNDANEDPTAGIVQLAASSDHIFAAVRPETGAFGDDNSGIALMDLSCTGTTIHVNILDAQTGQNGNRAQFLDAFSPQLTGTSGGGDVIFSTDAEDVNKVAFYYDDPFERLYIGVLISTGTHVDDIGKSVVVSHVDDNDALVLQAIAPDSAIDEIVDHVVVAKNAFDDDGPDLRANHLSVMHTSAGPSYLIVQGGIGKTDEVGNTLYALPLVDNPSDPAVHGTLADKDAELQNFKFVIAATAPDELATKIEPAAQVGSTPLPMLASDQISDMSVVGDAVFISIDKEASEDNDTGILYSQALFAQDGKIIDWTPWTKRASPMDLFPELEETVSGVKFFDVDASTGNIYIVEQEGELVGITAWTEFVVTDTVTDTTPLINKLNESLTYGCYSVLDLPQSVRGFTQDGAPLSRYALFGGVNKVAFARISKAEDTDPMDPELNTPQTVFTDFSDPENFLITQLPPESGCVQVLEYSRCTADEGDTNYFFAGTDNGLFAFTNTHGEGFGVDILSTFTQPPFSDGEWQKIPEIKGSVIDIKTSGLALYILTFETTAENPLKNTLYAVSFEPTLEEMFSPMFMNLRTLAQTKTEPVLGSTQLFTGIQIIATGSPDTETTADKEQLILATNQGLYKSNAQQTKAKNGNRGIADAEDQHGAKWQIVPKSTDSMYTGISGIETPIRHTTWPIRVADHNECASLDGSDIEQLSGNGDPDDATNTGEVGFAPLFFNADTDEPAFQALAPITYFFSDGGRRFFMVNPTALSSAQTKLSVIPFDTQAWDLSSPQTLKYPALQSIKRFFWVQTIGMTGQVLAGTDRGVIGLT